MDDTDFPELAVPETTPAFAFQQCREGGLKILTIDSTLIEGHEDYDAEAFMFEFISALGDAGFYFDQKCQEDGWSRIYHESGADPVYFADDHFVDRYGDLQRHGFTIMPLSPMTFTEYREMGYEFAGAVEV